MSVLIAYLPVDSGVFSAPDRVFIPSRAAGGAEQVAGRALVDLSTQTTSLKRQVWQGSQEDLQSQAKRHVLVPCVPAQELEPRSDSTAWTLQEHHLLMEMVKKCTQGRIFFWGKVAQELQALHFSKSIEECVEHFTQTRPSHSSGMGRKVWTRREIDSLRGFVQEQLEQLLKRVGSQSKVKQIKWARIHRQMGLQGYHRSVKALRDQWHRVK